MMKLEELKTRRAEIAAQLAPLAEARESTARACIASDTTKTVEAAENAARAFDRVARMLSIVDADIAKAEALERDKVKAEKRTEFEAAKRRALAVDEVAAFGKRAGAALFEAWRKVAMLDAEVDAAACDALLARYECDRIGPEIGETTSANGWPTIRVAEADAFRFAAQSEFARLHIEAGGLTDVFFSPWFNLTGVASLAHAQSSKKESK